MAATNGLGTYGDGEGTVTPLDHKMAQLGLIVKTAANTIRPGLFWDGNTTIVSGTANMSYNVRAFSAVTSRGSTAGAVLLTNDAVVNVATTAAPGSNSRIDVVYLWQREFSIDGTDSEPVIGVLQGTSAADPTAPSLASFPGAIELARIVVPSGVTATNSGTTITQTAPFTAVDGGVVSFRNTTEMAAWTSALTGQKAIDRSTTVVYVWDGSAWKAWESDWISYSPTLSNLNVGSTGSTAARYRWLNGEVEHDIIVTLGGTGVSVGAASLTTAVTLYNPSSGTARGFTGDVFYMDEGTGVVPGTVIVPAAGTTMLLRYQSSSSGVTAALTSSAPFTWAAGDRMFIRFKARPA
jgi:hypothetical protein